MRIFNTHPQAIDEFRMRTAAAQGNAQSMMTYAYKCKKCQSEMKTPAGRRKYQFGGWICPECAGK